MLEAALAYAARGWRIFPLAPGTKVPLAGTSGFKDATTDEETIRKWWTQWPNSNIGFATGIVHERGPSNDRGTEVQTTKSYIFVLDVDPRNGGTVPQGLVPTLTAITGGGGLHYYYRTSLPISTRSQYSTGVDIKAAGGYVILPPSRTTGQYKYIDDKATIFDAPDWLIDAIRRPDMATVSGSQQSTGDPNDTRPGSVFNRTASWEEILSLAGWTKVRSDNGEDYWRRPGKSEGISATTNYEGSDLLYVFSTSADIPEGCYNKFGAYAHLEHDGNFKDAARNLNSTTNMATANISRVEKYEFKEAFPAEHFVSNYMGYAVQQTDAPREYHEAVGLTLLATVGFKCSATLSPYPGGLRSNLYTLLVGDTTRSRKSTSQRIGAKLLEAVVPASVLPNRATPEALINALAKRNGFSSIWTPDEFGVTLSGIYNQTFMGGLEELLLTVYAGDDYTYERSTSLPVTIKRPSLSISGAATPESIGRSGATALESGLLPRFAIIYPKVLPEPRNVSVTPDLSVMRSNLKSQLKQILARFNTDTEITFEDGALSALGAAELSFIQSTQTARLPTMLYKVAMLSTIGRQSAVVNREDAESAIAVVNRWKQGIDNLVPMLYRSNTDPVFERLCLYAAGLLKDLGGTAPRTEIARVLRRKQSMVNDVENALIDWGMITLDTTKGKVWKAL